MGKEEFIQAVVIAAVQKDGVPAESEDMALLTCKAHELWCICYAEAQRMLPEGYEVEEETTVKGGANGHS